MNPTEVSMDGKQEEFTQEELKEAFGRIAARPARDESIPKAMSIEQMMIAYRDDLYVTSRFTSTVKQEVSLTRAQARIRELEGERDEALNELGFQLRSRVNAISRSCTSQMRKDYVATLQSEVDRQQKRAESAEAELSRYKQAGEAAWISVTDAMPPSSQDVFVLLGNAIAGRGYHYAVGSPIDGWYMPGDERPDNVTHWMKIPSLSLQGQQKKEEQGGI